MKTIDTSNPEDVARAFTDYINTLSNQEKSLAKALHNSHRTLQQSVMRVFLQFVELLDDDYKNNRFDARNETSCELANIIMKKTDEIERSLPFI